MATAPQRVLIVFCSLCAFELLEGAHVTGATYRSRTRRGIASSDEALDAHEVEKYIVREFGGATCIYERVCAHYAARAQTKPRPQLDWTNVFSQYNRSPDQNKEFYLLSVFLGDIIASPQLCHQLAKRRPCEPGDFR